MKNIKITDLEPGMMTAMDILTPSGHVLLPSGSKLTARHIRMLNARGIERVAVASAGRDPQPATSAVSVEDVRRRLSRKFQHNDSSHPFIGELVRLCESRLLNRE